MGLENSWVGDRGTCFTGSVKEILTEKVASELRDRRGKEVATQKRQKEECSRQLEAPSTKALWQEVFSVTENRTEATEG